MSSSYVLQQEPFVVPTTDGKLIEEHVGQVISNESRLSISLTSILIQIQLAVSNFRVKAHYNDRLLFASISFTGYLL